MESILENKSRSTLIPIHSWLSFVIFFSRSFDCLTQFNLCFNRDEIKVRDASWSVETEI